MGDVTFEDFPPGSPLVIRFNQPMASASPQPLIFSPPVRGEFEWSENNTVLTFTPDDGFSVNRSYWVNLHASVKARSGLDFTSVQRWRLQTQNTPQVARRLPTGDITDYQPTLSLIFNRPMDRNFVETAVHISPSLDYATDWDANTFNIIIEEPLEFGTAYEFMIDKTAVDQSGRHLATLYTWTTQLAEPVADVSWPTASNHLAPIVLNFNYPIDQASLSDALDIKPAIHGKLSWSPDYKSVELRPDSQLPASTSYTISFNSPLKDTSGNELPTPEAVDFTTPPVILSATPDGRGNHPAGSIRIRFDRPMDTASTEAAFQIEPALSGSFSWGETTLTFTPESGYLEENTDYTVTLASTARAANGEEILDAAYSWTFATAAFVDVADFGYGPNAQILDASGRRAIQFQAARRDSMAYSFQLYQLEINQFLSRYESGFHGWIWSDEDETAISTEGTTLLTEWQMTSTAPLQEWANVQEIIIPEDVPPASTF